ncbi:hypothetical protein H9L39_11588 [Fusarium oxysporum f. sp. albedinis]|nr:hypothetical protein H9L39_11588 [Fusarium oxysporum f. sp. albedinis]
MNPNRSLLCFIPFFSNPSRLGSPNANNQSHTYLASFYQSFPCQLCRDYYLPHPNSLSSKTLTSIISDIATSPRYHLMR